MATSEKFVEDLSQNYETLKNNLDQFFLIVMGIFILFMHAGFAFLETGSVRSKNVTNSIIKNVMDLFIGAIAYWIIGFALAYGEPGNAFIGHNNFASSNVKETNTSYLMVERYTNFIIGKGLQSENLLEAKPQDGYLSPSHYFAFWFFQFTFAISATTIASGAMAERIEFTSYMVYCFVFTGFVYPVVSHWGWAATGWLKSGAGTGLSFQDFAGSGIVHLTGGTSALVGALFLGPRFGRFNDDGSSNEFPGHSVTITALGSYILFVGFMAFNGGSELTILDPRSGVVIATAVMNTLLGGASAAICSMFAFKLWDLVTGEKHYWSLLMAINGGLAGMVSLCASCNDVHPWSACVIGAIAGVSLFGWHHFMLYLKIDDPLDAVAVHFNGGLCGVLLGPIFAIKGLEVDGKASGGIINGGSTWAYKNLGWSLLGAISIIAWTASITSLLFGIMKYCGILRVSEVTEHHGLDRIKHNEPAYPKRSNRSSSFLHNQEDYDAI